MENRENAIATQEQKQPRWTQEQIDAIKNTVAHDANESELTMFLSIANETGLDPFMHEIWFVNMDGRNTIITGKNEQ